MSIPLNNYSIAKDRICIGYFGSANEHLVQLRALRPNIEKTFPGIEVYIACRDEHIGLLKGERAVPLTRLKSERRQFGMIYELVRDIETHTVEQFFEVSDIPLEIPVVRQATDNRSCVICAEGDSPTRSLDSNQRQQIMYMAIRRGFRPEFGEDISNAGWVVGVECVTLYEAALAGIETSLIPTGIGTRFFGKLFPGYEVIKI